MFDVRELNVAIELWGVAFCAMGVVCTFMLVQPGTRLRNLLIALFGLELVAAGGDALAGLYRAQPGALAWAGTHVGNFLTFWGSLSFVGVFGIYVCERVREVGGASYMPWQRTLAAATSAMCVAAAAGAFYFIDESNVYHRGSWYWMTLGFAAMTCAASALITIQNRRILGKSATRYLLFYSVLPISAELIQIFVYGLNFVVVTSAMCLLIAFLDMQAHTSHLLVERERAAARAQAEAAESRVAVMVSQIQPHFLFNTLDSIYGLCDEDVGLAQEAIVSFSRYLRANLESLSRTTPVPVETELQHTRTYLDLERMSDTRRISYEMDIRARGFLVPALCVQTLAENAVKHGIGRREQGGTVTIRTDETAQEWLVVVTDDGVGFDLSQADGQGIGIQNTRTRLATMCGGTLEVESQPGHGTTATIRIPKHAESQCPSRRSARPGFASCSDSCCAELAGPQIPDRASVRVTFAANQIGARLRRAFCMRKMKVGEA